MLMCYLYSLGSIRFVQDYMLMCYLHSLGSVGFVQVLSNAALDRRLDFIID